MGFLDSIADRHFKTSQDGRILYFPNWPFGRGYIVPSEAKFQRLRRQVNISYKCIFIYILLLGSLLGPGAFLFGIIPWAIWNYIHCRDMERTDEKLTSDEIIAKLAQEFGFITLWLFEIFSVAFGIAGIVMFIDKWRNRYDLLISILAIFFSGWCAIRVAKVLMVKSRQGNRD